MSVENHKTIVRRLYEEVWNRGDLEAAADILARPDGVQAYVRAFRDAFPDVRHEIVEMIAEGDAIAIRWTAHATHTGPWHGIAATGAHVTWSGVTIAHLSGGKIVQHHTIWDTVGLLEQLGAVPRVRKADGSRL